jgi:hypothetical protein
MTALMRAWFLALLVLTGPAGAVAQPRDARAAIALPIDASAIAAALRLPSARPATVLLDTIRLVHTSPDARVREQSAAALSGALAGSVSPSADVAPLPLRPALWRDVLLETPAPDERLAAAILRERTASLMFFGLSGLDDDTLEWLAAHPATLRQLRARPAAFAAFGPSVHVRGGAVVLPAGDEAAASWQALIGAPPGDPAGVFAALFAADCRLAFFYDTVAHLDPGRRRFALGLYLPEPQRPPQLHALMRAFAAAAPEWRADERPFTRPPLDGAVLLSTIVVDEDGRPRAPIARRIWERVFRADALAEVPFAAVSKTEIDAVTGTLAIDASWIAARILDAPYGVGRRRLDTLLFAQRVFGRSPDGDQAQIATALRGFAAYPALMLALERAGTADPNVYAAAARRAAALSVVVALPSRRTAIALFQSAVFVIERARESRSIDAAAAERLLASLASLDVSSRDGYGGRFAAWFRDDLVRALPAANHDAVDDTVLAALAGAAGARQEPRRITWEGRAYLVDPAAAELRRLRVVRDRQGGRSLDAATTSDEALADALMSIVYAVHLGDPAGAPAMSPGVAARHDFALTAGPGRSAAAWSLPAEAFERRQAWHLRGSLLGLETALGALALRRVNTTEMPPEPSVGPQDRQTMTLTVALMNPFAFGDASRDAIVAAIRRGRDRVKALTSDAGSLDAVSRDAGLSEWRARAVAWEIGHGVDPAARFSLLELLWLGSAGRLPAEWDAWGAAVLPRTGCLCVSLPRPRPWEADAGYASAQLGTRAADVALRLAEALAELDLPASLTPALAGYTMQDSLEHARLARPDDWEEFGRAARELPQERLADYVSALAVGGPLVSLTNDERTPHIP